MFDRIPVYWYVLGALLSLALGIGLLYAGLSRLGPIALFGCILLTILAAIRKTTPPIERSPWSAAGRAAVHAPTPAPPVTGATQDPSRSPATQAPDREETGRDQQLP
ncbi:hypothetical protein [Kallotenue papyrolyticum]|uniref:hypothetical protein n=1 Tax=Kallotenue papyrolyticum TaxID=1325125 RepID=UPI00047854D2|nr:hypothetical protein [Kallotenue papyrolyticum]